MEPVIVITRHPDFSDEIEIYGAEIKVVYIDLGASFDVTKIGPEDREEIEEWAEGVRAEVADLPNDHPAKGSVDALVEEVLAEVRS